MKEVAPSPGNIALFVPFFPSQKFVDVSNQRLLVKGAQLDSFEESYWRSDTLAPIRTLTDVELDRMKLISRLVGQVCLVEIFLKGPGGPTQTSDLLGCQ